MEIYESNKIFENKLLKLKIRSICEMFYSNWHSMIELKLLKS